MLHKSLRSGIVILPAMLLVGWLSNRTAVAEHQLQPLTYNNPELVVDLGVGLWAWPLPMDYNGNGHLDLVVSCPDFPFAGTYFFENPGKGDQKFPVFKPPVRIADKMPNVQVSYHNGQPLVTAPGKLFLDFPKHQYGKPVNLGVPVRLDLKVNKTRANQWKLVDWDGDGDLDLIVGLGVWDDYGWDDAWDENGIWKNGPLHGYVYLVENLAIDRTGAAGQPARAVWKRVADSEPWPDDLGPRPQFAAPVPVMAGGKPIDVYGMPSPNLVDVDGDGDLDIICGEFLDGFTWFENIGTREQPEYAAGVRLGGRSTDPAPTLPPQMGVVPGGVRMDLQMITPVALDWTGNGKIDLICGDEDGRVALLEQLPRDVAESPETLLSPNFAEPVYFSQVANQLKFGALATPIAVDWDGDGLVDIVCGNTAGHVAFFKNLGQAENGLPRFAAPELLAASDPAHPQQAAVPIRELAGPNGSIQGPCEAKWGYSTLDVADWNHDGQLDLILNGIWGKVHAYLRTDDGRLVHHPLQVDWPADPPKPAWTWWTAENNELATQWRTNPCVIDWNQDGLNDLVMLDHEGYLAFYERKRRGEELVLLPPQRLFKMQGACEFDSRQRPVGEARDGLLRLNAGWAGASGRRKIHLVDWDGDGRIDLLVNSMNANWLRNVRTDDEGYTWFEDMGPLDTRPLAGHTTCPTTVDWNGDGIRDLLVGGEDGRLYYMPNPHGRP